MVIYVFLLEFSSPSHQKEWFKIWKIRNPTNPTNHIKESQSSHCIVVHEDAYLSYKRYKVEKLCLEGHPRYTSTNIYKHTLLLYYFLQKNNLKQNKRKKRKKQTNKTSKLDWLKPQHEPCKRSEKRINHLESCSLLIGDLDGDPFFCMNLCSDG